MRGRAAALVLVAALAAGCAGGCPGRAERGTVVGGRPLQGLGDDGSFQLLPPSVKVLEGPAPRVAAFSVRGVFRPSILLQAPGRLGVEIPAGARTLRFAMALRPVQRQLTVRVTRAGRPLHEETISNVRDWQERTLALPPGTGPLEIAVGGSFETAALGPLDVDVAAADERPNVLLYVVDCLRADHVGAFGARWGATPALDALAAEAVRFPQAFSCASWTKPSTGCLFTGLYPNRHGARTIDDGLAPAATTLAERFQAGGYATVAVVANPVLDVTSFGFGRGFDTYHALAYAHRNENVNAHNADAAEVTRTALAWLDGNRGRRFFMYAHSLDLHAPYEPHPPFDRRGPPGVEVLDTDQNRYLRELAYNDLQFAHLVAELKRRGLYDDMVVAVTADHGEAFGEHGEYRHGKSLHDVLLHVPLLVKLPRARAAGRRIADPVVNLDVAPTLLEAAGLGVPEGLQGLSLVPAMGGAPLPAREIYAEQFSPADALWAVRAGRLKLVRRLLPRPEEAVYDLRRDPGETRPRPLAEVPEATAFVPALDAFVGASLGGFHLRYGGGPPAAKMLLEVSADQPLDSVSRFGTETGDTLKVEPDRRSFHTTYTATGSASRVIVIGAPAGTTLRVRLVADGAAVPPGRLEAGGTAATSNPFTVAEPGLGAPGTGGSSWLRVGYLRPPAGARSAPVDPELRERMRALGYVQ